MVSEERPAEMHVKSFQIRVLNLPHTTVQSLSSSACWNRDRSPFSNAKSIGLLAVPSLVYCLPVGDPGLLLWQWKREINPEPRQIQHVLLEAGSHYLMKR